MRPHAAQVQRCSPAIITCAGTISAWRAEVSCFASARRSPRSDRPACSSRSLLLHYLFLALRLLGILRFQGPHSAAPYGLCHGAVAFRAESIPTILSRCTSRQAPEDEPAWTLHGVGAMRLCGWSTLERAAPDGSWRRETAPLSNHQVRTLAAARQVKELAALAGGRPHHLATHFEAYELEAFVSLLRWAGEGTGI